MKTWISLLYLSVALSATPTHANPGVLKIAINNWCPHVCVPSEGQPLYGYTTDIAVKILEDAGYKMEIITAPWRRIVADAEAGRIDIVASGYKGELPFMLFSEQPVGFTQEVMFGRADEVFRYEGPESLERFHRISVVDGAEYDNDQFSSYIAKNQEKFVKMKGRDIIPRQIKMLSMKRINAFISDRYVAQYFAQNLGYQDRIKSIGRITEKGFIYIGVSPKHPFAEKILKDINTGLTAVTSNGYYKRTLEKYGISPE